MLSGRVGTAFVSRPLSSQPSAGEERTSSDDLRAQKTEGGVGRGVVLLVDDEAIVRMSTADMLTDLGFEVIEVGSAEEALGLIRDGQKYDLIVTDHLMPGMTGVELAAQVKSTDSATPVLLVSGYAEVDGIPLDLPRLTKPFRNSDLAAVLHDIVPIVI